MANSKQFILDLFPDNNNNEISAADIRTFVNTIFDEEIDINEIQDNLISSTTLQPLSANQGRVLDDKISDNTAAITTKENSLGIGSEDQVLSMASGLKVWRTLPTVTQTVIRDDLISITLDEALSANQGRVLNNKISVVTANLVSTNSLISTNTANIDINTGAISALDVRVTNNSNLIGVNAASTASNLVTINQNTADIALNASNTITLAGRVTTTESRITTAEGDIDTNTADILTNKNNITSVTGRVTTAENDIDILDARVTVDVGNLTARVVAVENSDASQTTKINTNTADILTNANNTTALTGRVTTAENNITSVTGRITAAEGTIISHTSNIGTNSSNISALDVRLTTAESEIDIRDADILANTASIATNTANILTNTNNTTTLTGRVATTEGKITTLENNRVIDRNIIDSNVILIENNRVNIVANDVDIANLQASDITLTNNLSSLTSEVATKEPYLGYPAKAGYVLGSDLAGNRTWYPNAFNESFLVIDNLISSTDTKNALSAKQGYVLDQKVITKEDKILTPLNVLPPVQSEGTLVLTAKITDATDINGRVVGYSYDWQETGIGDLASLTTTDKDDLVSAINEVNVIVGDSAHAHTNKAILDATTASFVVADEVKLDFISVTQDVDLDTMESQIATNTSNIGTNTADIETNLSSIGNLETRVGLDDLSGLSLRIATNEIDIGNLETRVGLDDLSGLSLRIATNEIDIGTNAGNIATNAGNIATNAGNIATNAGNIASLDGRLTTAEGTIITNTGDIANREPLLPDDTGLAGYILSTDGFSARSWIPSPIAGVSYDSFISLLDTPGTYSGHTGRVLSVNSGEVGLDYLTIDRGYLDITLSESAGFLLNSDPKTWGINTATQSAIDTVALEALANIPPLDVLPAVQSAGVLVLTSQVIDPTIYTDYSTTGISQILDVYAGNIVFYEVASGTTGNGVIGEYYIALVDFISTDLDTIDFTNVLEWGIAERRATDYVYDWQESGIGTLSALTTTSKTDLVSAINELDVDSHTHTNKAILDATTASFIVADETKLDFITVTQAVDLDTMESQIATNITNIGTKADSNQTVATSTVYVDATTGLHYKMYIDNGAIVLEEIL